ncbi:MAG: molecular chaperone HtpG [Campylobacteraceae bacterium]|jgi:molecular chaperone HtpG|nr:molecular chaperone HtpG [Campylobacteraceae bacterium]
MAKHAFQTEIKQLLNLMIHSLYSDRDIFLRELISNGSDAMDKLQYLALTDEKYKEFSGGGKIEITYDKEAKTIKISDMGIGMNDEDMVESLGTIAKSGTKSFIEKLTGDAKKDSNLIGQFGVGFYSAFMVASKISVLSRKAGEEKAFIWESDGSGEYEIKEGTKESHGTEITLYIKDDATEYLSQWKLESIVKKYSDHIPFPIFMQKEKYLEGGKTEISIEQINKASALWRRPKNEITEDEYNEFYSAISHDNEKPLLYIHTKAEGTHEYTTLFYIPQKAPIDMYRVDYQAGVKLYVKRVFITDNDKELMPTYMRFVRGIIDAEDLPLNVSREILQQNRLLSTIKSASTKKILGELKKLAKADKEKYEKFFKEFGRALKEGLYSDYANRDDLLELMRFKSTVAEGFVSLEEYETRMVEGQKAVYYIVGDDENLAKNSPILEGFKAKNIEVLVLDDEIDNIVMPSVHKYKDFEIKNVSNSLNDEILKAQIDEATLERLKPLVEKLTAALGDKVKEVRVSGSLKDSAACVVFDDAHMTAQLKEMLKAMGQEAPESKPTFEINPTHPIISKLEAADDAKVAEIGELLFDLSVMLSGESLKDPSAFAKKVSSILVNSL